MEMFLLKASNLKIIYVVNEEVLHFIPWDIKDRMFAQLQKKIIRTYLKKKIK